MSRCRRRRQPAGEVEAAIGEDEDGAAGDAGRRHQRQPAPSLLHREHDRHGDGHDDGGDLGQSQQQLPHGDRHAPGGAARDRW